MKCEEERTALLAADVVTVEREVGEVTALLPRGAEEFRAVIDRLADSALLLPAQRVEARALMVEVMGGKPTLERDGDEDYLRVRADYRPPLRVAGGGVSNVVAGA